MLEIGKQYRVKALPTLDTKCHGWIVTVRSAHPQHTPTLYTVHNRLHGVDRDVAFYESELEPIDATTEVAG